MSCCASRRPPLSAGIHHPAASQGAAASPAPRLAAPPAFAPQRQAVFERVRATTLQWHSSQTGRHYRFNQIGDRLVVDPRDIAQLRSHPGLRML